MISVHLSALTKNWTSNGSRPICYVMFDICTYCILLYTTNTIELNFLFVIIDDRSDTQSATIIAAQYLM